MEYPESFDNYLPNELSDNTALWLSIERIIEIRNDIAKSFKFYRTWDVVFMETFRDA